jgi:hypothetical protein
MVAVVVRYETTATAHWALQSIVRAFFNDTITVAVWTVFMCARLMRILPHPSSWRSVVGGMMGSVMHWCFADPAVANSFAAVFDASH